MSCFFITLLFAKMGTLSLSILTSSLGLIFNGELLTTGASYFLAGVGFLIGEAFILSGKSTFLGDSFLITSISHFYFWFYKIRAFIASNLAFDWACVYSSLSNAVSTGGLIYFSFLRIFSFYADCDLSLFSLTFSTGSFLQEVDPNGRPLFFLPSSLFCITRLFIDSAIVFRSCLTYFGLVSMNSTCSCCARFALRADSSWPV